MSLDGFMLPVDMAYGTVCGETRKVLGIGDMVVTDVPAVV